MTTAVRAMDDPLQQYPVSKIVSQLALGVLSVVVLSVVSVSESVTQQGDLSEELMRGIRSTYMSFQLYCVIDTAFNFWRFGKMGSQHIFHHAVVCGIAAYAMSSRNRWMHITYAMLGLTELNTFTLYVVCRLVAQGRQRLATLCRPLFLATLALFRLANVFISLYVAVVHVRRWEVIACTALSGAIILSYAVPFYNTVRRMTSAGIDPRSVKLA